MRLVIYGYVALATLLVTLALPYLEAETISNGWEQQLVFYLLHIAITALCIAAIIYLHEGNKKNPSRKLPFALMALLVAAQLVNLAGKTVQLPIILEIAKNISNTEFATAHELQLGIVSIDGLLGEPTVLSIENYIASNTLSLIIINSSGGIIDHANSLASLIKRNRINILVSDHCESACMIVASSGNKLFAYPDTQFGFHTAGTFSDSHHNQAVKFLAISGTRDMTGILLKNGVPSDVLEVMNKTPNSSMSYYSGLELFERGVVTDLLERTAPR